MKRLCLIGISHACANSDILGKFSLSEESQSVFRKQALNSFAQEIVVLSTCNRLEIYFVSEKIDAFADAILFTKNFFQNDFFEANAYKLESLELAQHLFKVASGMDSQLMGETEIFGQIKNAYDKSLSEKSSGNILNVLFQKAIQSAKWIRTNTLIGKGKITLGGVVSDLSQRIFDDLKSVKILLIGSGNVGKDVAFSLVARGAENLTVASRTWENALSLSLENKCCAIDLNLALNQLYKWDIVICASSSNIAFLKEEHLANTEENKKGASLFLIDLAVPCNIEEINKNFENIFIYTLEDLTKIANENAAFLESEIEQSMEYITQKSKAVIDKITPCLR